MRRALASVLIFSACIVWPFSAARAATTLYDNLTPNNSLAIATRTDTGVPFEIEAADDFVVTTQSLVKSAIFTGLIVPSQAGSPSVSQVAVEIYRVFPQDSDVNRTSGAPTFSTSSVPTRVNSPSDVAFTSRDSAAGQLSFTSSVLAPAFTALNSIQPGGIHPLPNQTTFGNGPITGQEVQFSVMLATPFNLPAGHYFFVPQVALTNDGTFYWLSASRPISGAGTTPLSPDLQVWTRDANLDPDWLRAGTDVVDSGSTFNTAFALASIDAIPEPSNWVLLSLGFGGLGFYRRRRA